MKKLIISVSIVVGLIFIVLVFGFNFRDNDQNLKYIVTNDLNNRELAENITNQYF